jgi:protocatechuate 3,4-dioxygenase beta subunit
VCAICASCELTSTSAQFCTDARADGSYTLSGFGAVGYRISASAEGFAAGSANEGALVFLAPGESRTGQDITLSGPGAALAGQVLDAAGGPVVEANVRVVSWGALPIAIDVRSDQEGRFSLWTTPGRATLVAGADGYTSARAARTAPSDDVELVLTPAGSIEGIVVREIDGSPVAGAKVQSLGANLSPVSGVRSAYSAADGRFVIEGLEPAQHLVTASAPGYAGRASQTVAVALGATVSGVRVVLSPVAQVSGVVIVGASGTPCKEGSVILGPPSPEMGLRPGAKIDVAAIAASRAPTTLHSPIGADGAVHFDAVPAGQYFATVQCQGHTFRDGPERLTVKQTDVSGLTWKVERGCGLAIQAVDGANKPLPGAEVLLDWPVPAGSGATPRMMLVMDREGKHTTPSNLYPGVYTLRAGGGYRAQPVTVSLREGAGVVSATLRMQDSGSIVVRVRSARGRGVDDLTLRARLLEAASGADTAAGAPPPEEALALAEGDGQYRMRPLAAGSYRVMIDDGVNAPVDAATLARRPIQVGAGASTTLEVIWARDARITGRVVDAAGAPVVNAWVSASPAAAQSDVNGPRPPRPPWDHRGRVLSDTTGHFALENLSSGIRYKVRAEDPEGAAVVREATPGTALELLMPETGSIRGVVTDDAGKRVDSFALRVVDTSSGTARVQQFADSNGEFSVSGLAPGSLQITALERSGRLAQSNVQLLSGQRLDGLVLHMPGEAEMAQMNRRGPLPLR